MVDISVTSANVTWVSGTAPRKVKGGASITPGEALYKDSADNEHKLAQADADSTSELAGIALSDGENGRDMLIAPPGARVNFGATLTAGTVYALSAAAAGGIAPLADITNEQFVVIVTVGEGTAVGTIVGYKGPVAVPAA